MPYNIEFRDRAFKDLRRRPPKIARQLQEKVDSLSANPRPEDSKRVRSAPGLLRVDSGEYRILYEVDDNQEFIAIVRIRHRREAYR